MKQRHIKLDLARCILEVVGPRMTSRVLQTLKGIEREHTAKASHARCQAVHTVVFRRSAAVEGKIASDSTFSDTEMAAELSLYS
jgi:hypothetical protein